MADPAKLIPLHGGYRKLKSFQVAQLVYEALSLLNLGCYFLDRQIDSLEKAFVEEGGFTERLYRVRNQRRNQR
jgi:four helix bundle suffix protein